MQQFTVYQLCYLTFSSHPTLGSFFFSLCNNPFKYFPKKKIRIAFKNFSKFYELFRNWAEIFPFFCVESVDKIFTIFYFTDVFPELVVAVLLFFFITILKYNALPGCIVMGNHYKVNSDILLGIFTEVLKDSVILNSQFPSACIIRESSVSFHFIWKFLQQYFQIMFAEAWCYNNHLCFFFNVSGLFWRTLL